MKIEKTAMSNRIWALIFFVAVLLLALGIAFPEQVVYLTNRLSTKTQLILAITPMLLYVILGFVISKYLWTAPRDAVVIALDRQEASSLALTGFCFTSLSFLLAFFKDEIKKGEQTPEGILLFFAVALGSFVASFMVLRYRTKNLFSVLNEALLDNGLWCVLVGFWAFFNATLSLKPLSIVFTVFAALYLGYLGMHFSYWIKYARAQMTT